MRKQYNASMLKAFTFRLPTDLMERVDAARGDVNRTRWVQRALESTLSRSDSEEGAHVGMAPHSASSRAPVEKEPSEAKGPAITQQADRGPVVSSEAVRSAAPSRPARNPALSRQAALNKAKGL
jgi:predicted transcriptional regulator